MVLVTALKGLKSFGNKMSYSFANQKLSGFLIFKKKKRNKKAYSGQWHLRSLKSITPWDLTHLSQCPCTLQNCEVLFQDHHHCRNAISLISSMKWNHFQVIFLALEKSQKPLGLKNQIIKGCWQTRVMQYVAKTQHA